MSGWREYGRKQRAKQYITREKVKVLVEALEDIAKETHTPYGDQATKALAVFRGEQSTP